MTKVVLLDKAKVQSVSDTLRAIADGIDANQFGEIIAGNVVLETINKRIEIFAMGDSNYYKTVANLTKAIHILVKDPN